MRRPSSGSVAALALAAVLSSGCYQLTVRSGLPPAPTPAVNGRTTGAWVNGLVDEEPVLNLGTLCPAGWAEIHYEVGFLTGLVNGIRGLIYHGTEVTVRCAVGPPPQPVLYVRPPPPEGQVVVAPPPAPPPTPNLLIVGPPPPAPPAPAPGAAPPPPPPPRPR